MIAQQHAITGVVPPQTAEVRIRDTWPSVASSRGVAGLGRALTRTIVLAPLAWLIMAGAYFAKVLPFTARRYCLTNRRVMVRRGWAGKVSGEAPLENIREVVLIADDNTDFFRAATLQIVGAGNQILLELPGVRDPENFRRAILSARDAWFPRPA